jgi:ATP-binding cassette subfamily F protein uup
MFLDHVATSTLVYEGTPEQPGLWREYEGGVQDWLTQSQRARALQANAGTLTKAQVNAAKSTPTSTSTSTPSVSVTPAPDKSAKPRKLSYKEQRELEGLPDVIADLETEQRQIQEALADPTLYTQDAAKATQLHRRDAEIEAALMHALERWEALSN